MSLVSSVTNACRYYHCNNLGESSPTSYHHSSCDNKSTLLQHSVSYTILSLGAIYFELLHKGPVQYDIIVDTHGRILFLAVPAVIWVSVFRISPSLVMVRVDEISLMGFET